MSAITLRTAGRIELNNSVLQDTKPAAVDITAGKVVYEDSNGKWALAAATAVATCAGLFLALKTVKAGMALTALRLGEVDGFDLTGVNPNTPLYLSDTAGGIDTAAGTIEVIVGRVTTVHANRIGRAVPKVLSWNPNTVCTDSGQLTQPVFASVTTSGATERILSRQKLGGGKYLTRAYIEEALEFTADAYVAGTTNIPAGAKIVSVHLNNDTLVVLDTAVKVGIGTAADPDGLGIQATLTKNAKLDQIAAPTLATFAAATAWRISAVDTNGAAAGTVTSGTVRARIVYDRVDSLPDAA